MERFAVIGMGRFGRRLAMMLSEAGAEVIAIDRRRDLVEQVRDHVSLAVSLDSTNEEALRAQGIDQVDVAVVGIGADFEAAALTTVILKQLGIARVISRATNEIRGQVLSRIGADDIVNPEQESAERWANRLLAPSVIERIELAEGFSLAQLPVPQSFHGKTLEQLAIRRRYQVNVVAIRRKLQEPDEEGRPRHFVITVPNADSIIQDGDVLVVIGSDDAISSFPAGKI